MDLSKTVKLEILTLTLVMMKQPKFPFFKEKKINEVIRLSRI